MTRAEIAEHLLSEFNSNRKRIESKVGFMAKKMIKAGRKVCSYEQHVGSNTLFTIYIYGIDDEGVDYASGLWFRSDKGLCWATNGKLGDVIFYNDHFFERYAERHLKRSMNIKDVTLEFYKEYKVSMARHTDENSAGVRKIQLPLHVGGLALGLHYETGNFIVFNTYVSEDILFNDQINNIDTDSILNEKLQEMKHSDWELLGKFMRSLT